MIHPHESATFAALIESRMEALKLDQVALERRSQITDTSWARWRSGSLPSIKAFFPVIAATLEVPLDDLLSVIDRDRASRPKVGRRVDTVEQAKALACEHAHQPTQAVDA